MSSLRLGLCLSLLLAIPCHAQLNTWVSLQPDGPDNALGGYLVDATQRSDGSATALTEMYDMIARPAPDAPWIPYQPLVDGQPQLYVAGSLSYAAAPQTVTAVARLFGQHNAIVRSTDGGVSWSALLTFGIFDSFRGFTVAPSDPDIIYAFFDTDELRKSVDGGASWTTIAVNSPGFLQDLSIDPANSSTLYAIGDGTFLKSLDGGVTWTPAMTGLPPAYDYLDSLAIDQANPGTIYAGSGNWGQVFKTTNAGDSWQTVGLPLSINTGPIGDVAIDPSDSNNVYALTVGGSTARFARSGDAGATWSVLSDPDEVARYGRFTFSLAGELLFYGSTGAAMLDANGAMRASNQGFSEFIFEGIRVAPGNSDAMYGISSFGGIAATNPAPPLWELRRTGMGASAADLHVDANDPGFLRAVNLGGLYESTDGGRQWLEIAAPVAQSFYELEVAPGDDDVMHLRTSSGLVRTLDGGTTWNVGLANGNFPAGGLWGPISIASADGSIAYAGTAAAGVYVTDDSGATWSQASTPFSDLEVVDIAADPALNGDVYVATRNSVWALDDTSDSWSEISDGRFASSRIRSIAVDAVVPGRVFVYHDDDAWYFDPRTSSWTYIATTPPVSGGYSSSFDLFSADPNRSGRLFYTISRLYELQMDSDFDDVADHLDNCILTTNDSQLDADGDGIGNACDADINNDCIVNAIDLGALRAGFFGSDPVLDFNGDGMINAADLGVMRQLFFEVPGPSGISGGCESAQ